VSLPTAPPLPYTYKNLPSTLPPSSTSTPTGATQSTNKPKFILSSTGHAAHPDEIIASCRALQAHVEKLKVEAQNTLNDWEREVKERDIAEKRRVAPGWLDREEKILEPEKNDTPTMPEKMHISHTKIPDKTDNGGVDAGTDLDLAFGAVNL